jgi:uncharacterized oxidoreductase
MQMQGNTIFITGGSSGIGRGLAEAFHQRGNQVIISGRREFRLKELCHRHPGLASYVMDVTSAESIKDVAQRVVADCPALNCVINNAGVQMHINFSPESALEDEHLQMEIATNLLAPIRVTAAFLPHLATQPHATLINVSSGLAFVPVARFPVYCATKAAIHSWTMSLRHQLRNTKVKVIELIPPYVATELGGAGKPALNIARPPMPLDAFVTEAMKELESDADEVAIAEAKRLVAAASPESVKKLFSFMNG